jgi:hypothetical protein
VAQEGVRALYEEILATDNPKAQIFFNQWKILFGEVCGYDVENVSEKLKKLAEFYVVKGKPQTGAGLACEGDRRKVSEGWAQDMAVSGFGIAESARTARSPWRRTQRTQKNWLG